ncbi:MAG: glycosyltransferase [Gammaproteobacteria bacterium]|nr:glycosyltransferase [Gammaproteobacteria bacterium]
MLNRIDGERGTGLLSVLIPNFNYGPFIERAIRSVVEQDYGPIELIVVDDGSKDDSVNVIEAALNSDDSLARSELIAFKRNRGKLAALNAALKVAQGEYAIILDSDDYLAGNYASRCIAELRAAREQDAKIGFVYTDCTLVDGNDQFIDRGRSTMFDASLVDRLSFLPEPALTLTEALQAAAPFDESIRRATKHHKWRRIVADGWAGLHIAEPLFYYRMHDANMSGIGQKVLSEVESGTKGARILSGYWELSKEKLAAG